MDVRGLAWEYMNDPAEVELTPDNVVVEKISQELYHVSKREKMSLLLGILNRDLPKNALIVTNMKHVAVMVAHHLERSGYKCQYLMGDLPQSKRQQVIDNFKDGNLSFLVATDVAARGLHIDNLEMVVNYDLPQDPENYVHRIGRTARVGKSGKAISFACEETVYNLDPIERYIKMKIPSFYPDEKLFHNDLAGGFDTGDSRRRGRSPSEKTAMVKTHGGSKRKSSTAPVHGSPRPTSAGGPRRPDRDPRRPAPPPAPAAAPEAKAAPLPVEPRQAKTVPSRSQERSAPGASKPGASKKGARRPTEKLPVNVEDRMAYYRKKYGDSFPTPAGTKSEEPRPQTVQPPAKRSLLKRLIATTFRKGKK